MSRLAEIAEAAQTLQRTRSDPVWFMEHILNLHGDVYYLDAWQKELADAVGDVYRKKHGIPTRINHEGKCMITVRAMHGPGKTFGVAAIMHWFNNAFKGRIICTAPKQEQLKTRLWPNFRKIAVRAGREYSSALKIDTLKITWHGDEDWCALAETASQPENLAGYHDDNMLVIVDEASGVAEEMYPVIEGMVSTGNMVIVLLIGNPTKNQGTFFASHCTPKVAKHYYPIHVDLNKTTRVNREWVQRMEDKYGRGSPVVKVRCYGEFADADAAQLIPYDWVAAAMERESRSDGSIKRLRIAVDVADGGEDFTVITAARLYETGVDGVEQVEHAFPSSESPILAAQAAIAMFEAHGGSTRDGDDFVVDSLGVGAGTAGYLIERGYNVVAYKGGAASDDVTQWRNRRTQSYIVMRDAYRDGKLAFLPGFLPEDELDEFAAQTCSVRTKPGSERLEELETKESMKRRGLKSPDKADSVAMLFATQEPQIAERLEIVGCGSMLSAQENW